MEDFISLYDFLGRPAGGKLGKEVSKEAVKQRIKMDTRDVNNPNYQGIVYLYPESFLKTYFSKVLLKQLKDKL
tara:strand:- start:354 stop:572 length:219 start_codon:yes stop_codon:yes gene_type:complete